MQNSELYSSSLHKDLITFVGFKEYLVLNFIRDNLRYLPENIYLFTSSKRLLSNEKTENEKIIEKVKEIANKNHFNVIENRQYEIWDIKLYYSQLSDLPKVPYVINLSAGPAVFSAAAMLWALERNVDISYSIEHYESNVLTSVVFKNINMKSISNLIYAANNVDRYIIDAIKAGRNDSSSIMEYLKSKFGYEAGIRTIQLHIKKLEELNIITTTKSKTYKIDFSDNLKDFGYYTPNYYK